QAPRGQLLIRGDRRVARHAQHAGERACRGQTRAARHPAGFDGVLQLTRDLQRERFGLPAVEPELALQLDLGSRHAIGEYPGTGGLSPCLPAVTRPSTWRTWTTPSA